MEDEQMETFITEAMANMGFSDTFTGIPAEPGTEPIDTAATPRETRGFFGKLFAAGNGARRDVKEYNLKKKQKKLAKLKASLGEGDSTAAVHITALERDITGLTQEIYDLSLEEDEERMREAWSRGTRAPRTFEAATGDEDHITAGPSKFEQWLLQEDDDKGGENTTTTTGAPKKQQEGLTANEAETSKKAWLADMERRIRDAPAPGTAATTTNASKKPASLTQKTTVQDFMDRHERDIRRREPAAKDVVSSTKKDKSSSSTTMPTATLAPSMGQVRTEMKRQFSTSPISTQLNKLDDLMTELNAPTKKEESSVDELIPDGPETDAFARGARDWIQSVVSLKPITSFEGVVPLRDILTGDSVIDTVPGGRELESDTLSVSVDKTRRSIVVTRLPLEVVRGNTRILIFRRVNDPVPITKESMYSINKGVGDPARVTLKFSHPIHGTPAKILLRPAQNEKQALSDATVWVGRGIKNRLYILRFSAKDALQEVILVYPTANIAEAYHEQILTRAERALGDVLVGHAKQNVHLSTDAIPPITAGTNAFPASFAMAAAFAHGTPQTAAAATRDHIHAKEKQAATKAVKISSTMASSLQRYINALETLSTESARIYKVTEQEVAGDRGKLLAAYVEKKVGDPKLATNVTAAFSDAWKVLHMQTTSGHVQETKDIRDKYLAALAKSTNQKPPVLGEYFG
jgi:hypothetical protein